MIPRLPILLTLLLLLGASSGSGARRTGKADKHWSFQPLKSFEGTHSIDSFITAKLKENGLQLSPKTDPVTWLRRVTFDLTGLPPTPNEVAAFQKSALLRRKAHAISRSETAEAALLPIHNVVDRLLASPRYGERWAQHWLDVVRYADTHGFEVNTERPHAWPYRDYVIAALNNDTPYDQFIREQLAGDASGKDAATGFLVTSAVLLPGQIGKDDASKRLARQDELGEIVINTTETFLALTLGCARCHDHKSDPLTARDYYALQAFFAGVEYGDRSVRNPKFKADQRKLVASLVPIDHALAQFVPLARSDAERPPVNARENIECFTPVLTKKIRLIIDSTNRLEPCIDEFEVFDTSGKNIALAEYGTVPTASGSRTEPNRHELRQVNDGHYGNSRSWMSNEVGGGWIQLEFKEPKTIDRAVWGRDRQGKFADRLPLDYRIEIADETDAWHTVADSTDRKKYDPDTKTSPIPLADLDPADKAKAETLLAEKKSIRAKLAAASDGNQLIYAGKFKSPESMHLLHRGDPEQPKDTVSPNVPQYLGTLTLPKDSPDQTRRLALADWITAPDNPLTARVLVNRIWQGHFGIGLVETANDFGLGGTPPTHPDLLDWLASELIRSGWSIKHLHRLIVLSDTYAQSSKIITAAQKIDADVRLLWRFPSRRLESEVIRDSMLATSGRLNLKTGGPGFDLFKSRGGLNGFPPVESFTGDGLRRMIYAHKIRMEREAVFGAFDCPDAGQSAPRRRQSTTPIQALNLFNSTFTIEESEALAARVRNEAGPEIPAQITRAYQLAYNRPPTREEQSDAAEVVRSHGLETLCRAIYNSSEFLFLP